MRRRDYRFSYRLGEPLRLRKGVSALTPRTAQTRGSAPDADSADEGKLADRRRFALARRHSGPRAFFVFGRFDMDVIVNGETETCTEAASVADLLQTRGHDPKTVVVEHNGNIVPADAFAATQLHGGDVLEIVQFVGGG